MTVRTVPLARPQRDALDSVGDPLLHLHDQRRRSDAPELRLFVALLEDACFCLAPRSLVDRETRLSAVAWVLGEVDSLAACSFHEVCAILGFDEDATRARLLAVARGV